MERYFCRDKKDYCDILNCKSCEFAKGHGVIDGVYANDVLTTLFGENYDLDRLKQLIEADREGRCAILSEPMKPMAYKPNDTDVYCPNCGETLSGGWPLAEWEDGRTMYQCPYCGQSIDTQVCVPYKSALKAMKERENDV